MIIHICIYTHTHTYTKCREVEKFKQEPGVLPAEFISPGMPEITFILRKCNVSYRNMMGDDFWVVDKMTLLELLESGLPLLKDIMNDY